MRVGEGDPEFKARNKVQNAWAGSKPGYGERNHSSGYAGYLAGEIDFEADDDAYQELCKHASMLIGCIEFPEENP